LVAPELAAPLAAGRDSLARGLEGCALVLAEDWGDEDSAPLPEGLGMRGEA